MALSGNKGEWSEPYVLLKLLAEQKLQLGDENLKIISNLVYPIVKIIRFEKSNKTEFSYEQNIVVVNYDKKTIKIPIKLFLETSRSLFEKIKVSKGSVSFPDIEKFLNTINVYNSKASSLDKTDITIQIHDIKTLLEPILGFSIKSQLGKASTLVNASGATNFKYKINGSLDESKLSEINNEELFAKRFELLKQYGCTLQFIDADKEIFKLNLQTIDTHFPEVMGRILLLYYANADSKQNTVKNWIEQLTKLNPLNYNLKFKHNIYEMKMKKFLTDYALGMRAATVWNGIYEATGGYIIVRNDGELICYHFYYKNQFEDYLLANTKLETASTSKHEFGDIYKEGNEYFLKLNLQIRFLI